MFLYFNFRKNCGLINYIAFHKQEGLSSFVLKEIKSLIDQDRNNVGIKNCPPSKDLENYIDALKAPTLTQLNELINKYEEWTAPCAGPALLHEVREFHSVKDIRAQ